MERRVVPLDRAAVSYLVAEPAGTPRGRLVLLHGGGADSAELSWGGLLDPLAERGYAAYAPDAPGYGHSGPPKGRQGQAELEARAAEFVDALGLEDAVVGGLSMGGGVSLGLALRRAAAGRPVPGLVLLGSYGLMPGMGRWAQGAAALWVWSRLGPWATRTIARSPRLVRASMSSLVRDPAAFPAGFDELLVGALRGDSAKYFQQWQLGEVTFRGLRTDYRDRLGELGCPVLLVHGEKDPGVPLRWARQAADRLADAELVVVPGGRHWVQRDAPRETLEAVSTFLGRVCRVR
ncbi:alpha/beta hydrolase [Mariniluteicoccus endophyticus]